MRGLAKCVECNGRGHMDDSRDMDNGYGRWWKSTPTPCEWCGGKGHDCKVKLARLELIYVEAEVQTLDRELKAKRQRMRELTSTIKSAKEK